MKMNWNILVWCRFKPRSCETICRNEADLMPCSLWCAVEVADGSSRCNISDLGTSLSSRTVSLPSSRHNVCSVTALSFIPSVCHSSVQLMPRQHVALPSALGLSSKTCSELTHAKKCMKYAWHAPEGTMFFDFWFLILKSAIGVSALSYLHICKC